MFFLQNVFWILRVVVYPRRFNKDKHSKSYSKKVKRLFIFANCLSEKALGSKNIFVVVVVDILKNVLVVDLEFEF